MPAWTEILNGMLGGGIATLLVALIGFIFREKWKQILQRSLVRDMEQIKHDFERELAAYKVSLIAQAEAAKAKEELKKSIALRYAEIEFERIVELENVLYEGFAEIILYATVKDGAGRTDEHLINARNKFFAINNCLNRAEMFLTPEAVRKLHELLTAVAYVVEHHIGANRPVLPDSNSVPKLIGESNRILRARIKELGKY